MTATRRPRLSAEETRERLLAAGLADLARQGMSIGLDAVNLEQAVRDAGVSRSSAYAVWSTDDVFAPQELFQRAVLRRAVEDRTATIDRLQESATAVYLANVDTMSHRELLAEIIRVAGTENVQAVADSPSWQLVIAIRAILHSAPDDQRDDDLAVWMRDNEEELRHSTVAHVFKPFVEVLGIEPRPEYGELAYQYGEISASSACEGLAMRYSLRAHEFVDGLVHPTHPDPDKLWSLYALMFENIVHTFFRPSDGSDW